MDTHREGFAYIALILAAAILVGVYGYIFFIDKPPSNTEPSTNPMPMQSTEATTTPSQLRNATDSSESDTHQQIAPKVQTVLPEMLKGEMEVTWNVQPPQGFDPTVALQKVKDYVYAFPGYRYQSLKVEVTDTKVSFTRNSREREEAQQRGDFLFDVVIHGRLSGELENKNMPAGGPVDSYFFNISFSEKSRTYTLTGKEFTLRALPPELIAKSEMIAKISKDSSSSFEAGWLKRSGGEFWYEGAKDGTVYITVSELDDSGPELALGSWRTFYIDPFMERVIKTTQSAPRPSQ